MGMKQIPLYEHIYETMRDQILDGTYPIGQRLPSEKQLEDIFHVSRITSKKAMTMLANEGIIERIPGRGSFVSGHRPEKPAMASDGVPPLIGLIVDGFSPSFAYNIVHSIESTCSAMGCSLVLRCSDGSLERETQAINDLVKVGVKGLLIMCVHNENYNERILQLVINKFPVVTIDRQLKGLSVPFVGTDNVSAARELTATLLSRGYRKIAFVRPEAHETVTLLDRQLGFQLAYNDYGLIADENLWITNLRSSLPESQGDNLLEQDIAAVDDYLLQHPETEAFMASEYNLAQILKFCLQRAGRYEEDMIVCFDGPEQFLAQAEFTHVAQGEKDIGRISVEILMNTIEEKQHPGSVMVPYRIVTRDQRIWGDDSNGNSEHP